MPTLDDAFEAVRAALGERFGLPASGFDGLAPFEAMVAVYLSRTIGAARSAAALEGLRDADLLLPERLAAAAIPEIVDALTEKSIAALPRRIAPLKQLARWLVDHHDGRTDWLLDPHRAADSLRAELAAINGIGPAGADAFVLHALERPSYPVDRATFRVLVRHGWLDPTASYDEARAVLVDSAAHATDGLADDEPQARRRHAARLAQLSHGMEQVGRQFCRVAAPQCDGCPLQSLLPEGGPREIDG